MDRICIAVVGTRSYQDYETFCLKLNNIIKEITVPITFVSGGERKDKMGADSLIKRFCIENKYNLKEFYPNYNEHIKNPKIAPLLRNTLIAEACDIMIAFWNGFSKGTLDSISKAISRGKEVYIFPTERRSE